MFLDTNLKDLLSEWKKIENALPFKPGSLEYQHAWGEERELFYQKYGHIPCPQSDIERMITLKGAFKGERIFVIGNGPSLNITPLDMLENEFTFMVNRGYLLYDQIKWRPSFYTATDWRVVPDIAHEINLLTGTLCFFEERFRGLLREGDDVYWYTHNPATLAAEKIFAYNIELGVRGAGSVIGTAIQIAYYLGFNPIYLIGCDLGYHVKNTVVQEGADVFGTGTKLFLTSTEDDDPNHFDKRYFGAGSRWHDPNVNRMISGHKQCIAGVEAKGGKILNATIGGELEIYPRVEFQSLFNEKCNCNKTHLLNTFFNNSKAINPIPHSRTYLIGPYLRCENINLDETDIVYNINKSNNDKLGVMIDVGAHRGNSCLNFLELGWTIFAFEPDENNRAILIKRAKESEYANSITIDQSAVGARCQENVPYFSSEQSSGISGLLPFHPSHTETAHVNVITLSEYLKEKDIKNIDFLKIDTEGNDLFVLQGFPWNRYVPNIIVCEFEDEKTHHLGYTWNDICKYLLDRGYSVYVSEWHPIIRYGVRHNWLGLKRYPCQLEDSKAWGNLIAFKNDPGDSVVEEFFKETIIINTLNQTSNLTAQSKIKKVKIDATKQIKKLQNLPEYIKHYINQFRNFTSRFQRFPRLANIFSYVRFAERIRNKNLTLFRIGQFSMWTLRVCRRHPIVLAAGLFVFITINYISAANPQYIQYREYVVLTSYISLVIFFIFLCISFINEKFLNYVKKEQQNRNLHNTKLVLELKNMQQPLYAQVNEQKVLIKRLEDKLEEYKNCGENTDNNLKDMRNELGHIVNNVQKQTKIQLERVSVEFNSIKDISRLALKQSQRVSEFNMDTMNVAKQTSKEVEKLCEKIKSIQDISQLALDESQKVIKSNLEKINVAKQNSKELEGIIETINSLKDISQRALEESKKIAKSHLEMRNKANYLNSGIYQHFNRQLQDEHIEKILKIWCPLLGIERINRKALGYLAHRICHIENNCSGRLATNLEDALLRVIISQSVKGQKIDVLEIGSLFGVSLAIIYDNCRALFDEIHLTALDPLEGYYEKNAYDITTKIPVKKTVFEHNMRIMDIPKEDITLIQCLSTENEAKNAASKHTYDVLLIDGDHSYDGVKYDFDNYHPYVKKGGYVIFDDYNATEWPGVSEFVDKELKQKENLQMIGNEWRTAVFKIL